MRVFVATTLRGASNAKAKRELGWEPRHPSWREGFVAAYATTAPAERRKPEPATQSPSRRST
jgi:nucleoside-diphosphate-sugar epimerase